MSSRRMTTASGRDPTRQRSFPRRRRRAAADPYEPLLQRLTSIAAGANEDEDRVKPRNCCTRSARQRRCGGSPLARTMPSRPCVLARYAVGRRRGRAGADSRRSPRRSRPRVELVKLRLRRAASLAAARWAGASIGGGLSGLLGGAVGGLILLAAPGNAASLASCSGVGCHRRVLRCRRRRGSRRGLIGRRIDRALASHPCIGVWRGSRRRRGGFDRAMARAMEPRGTRRRQRRYWRRSRRARPWRSRRAWLTASRHPTRTVAWPRRAAGGAFSLPARPPRPADSAALALAVAGRPLVGGTIHLIADASVGSQVNLTSLGRFIGESDFGPLTAALIATGEGALFGFGLALGLTHRPSISRTSHSMLTKR